MLHSLAGIIRPGDGQVQLRGGRIDKLGDVQLNEVAGTTINNSGACNWRSAWPSARWPCSPRSPAVGRCCGRRGTIRAQAAD
ncbi:hypothetical protein [Streptomyces soliscabiei]|uniref:hypothetical protein n=1 Tax=Streptomyces soliscabiei TaxID=588897 RepID=UPI0029B33D13|nr:hypothetical protein [Streptomyces sp. NY05-11A]MDX2682210.1 hypothetical protein [Streptomyces sp. NY05-11A]